MYKKLMSEQKSKIGFAHGILTILGSIVLGYMVMMVFSKFIPGDYAVKIMPSVILTPITISICAIWLLFSKTTFACIMKTSIAIIILLTILKVF